MGDAVGQSPKYALEARFLSAGGLSSSERKGVCFRRLYWLTIDKKKIVSISACCREEM